MRPGPLEANICRQRAKKFPHFQTLSKFTWPTKWEGGRQSQIFAEKEHIVFLIFPSLPKHFKIVRGRTPAANIGTQRTTLKKGLTQCSHFKIGISFYKQQKTMQICRNFGKKKTIKQGKNCCYRGLVIKMWITASPVSLPCQRSVIYYWSRSFCFGNEGEIYLNLIQVFSDAGEFTLDNVRELPKDVWSFLFS